MSTPLRAVSYLPPGSSGTAADVIVLLHDERRVRRRLLRTQHGIEITLDFPQPLTLESGGRLQLEDGRTVEVIAGEEQLYEVRGRDATHLMQLCWHIGNRHAKAQVEREHGPGERVLIQRDHVLREMLIGLGATVREVSEPFQPLEGAYHGHGHEQHALLNR